MTVPVYKCYRTVANENGFPMGIRTIVTEDQFFRLFGYKPNFAPVGYIHL